MKNICILCLLCSSFLLSAQSIRELCEKDQKERIGQPMSEFKIKSLNGDTARSEQLQGKITLFNFWAAWCGACVAELRPLDEMYNRLKEYSDFQFLSVATVEQKGVSPIVRELQLSYEVYIVGDEQMKELITFVTLPATIITDRDGNIIYYERGGATKEEGARKELQKLEMKLIDLLNQ